MTQKNNFANSFASGIQPKVSVCCATYNHGKFIRQALESIFMQRTNFPFEVIVHDDASTDDTADIVREFEAKHDNMTAIYQEENQYSKGVGSINVNFTLPLARAPYVIINEGDDFFTDPLKLQKQADYLDAHPEYSMCFHPVRVLYEDGSQPDGVYPTQEMLGEKNIFRLDDLLKTNFIQTNSCMYRWGFHGDTIKKAFPKNIFPGDYYMHFLHATIGKIGFIDEVMACYRRHKNGLWSSISDNQEKIYTTYGSKIFNFSLAVEKLIKDDNKYYHSTNVIPLLQYLLRFYIEKNIQIDAVAVAKKINNHSIVIPAIIFEGHKLIAEKKQAIAARDQEIAARDQAIAARDQEIVAKDQAIAARDQALGAVSQELHSVYNSRSWEITKPLRALAGCARAARKKCMR